MIKKKLLKDDIKYFEELSKISSSNKVIDSIKRKYKIISIGASALVFTKYNLDYVVKIGDSLDMIPRKTSKFHKYYAKIIWRSKNKKIIVQEKVNTSNKNTYKAIKLLSKKFNLDINTLDEKYDIRIYNVGIKNNKPKIIDYRNYSTGNDFSMSPHWYGHSLENIKV